mmetsp:Transcript_11211/g.27415  ORF Transcript_11211/g.27415 Transcript_11211/m.27415 type:complete len:329 (+) Transcript_11211:170-1156(+)|eukprot:CAMPEP_0178993492 /NCGR_PEP_ID=MMETSP0795-20121207/6731_1 /TAXON_ID=88552 /ORGANISM="Amoebophrya sp., Strain Ameob2" /LENGTH=328 /DNA_ID=CAMNT_0020685553 /DNA_START=165 /DNA_END=1151 /DNA_ORIENTATION=+
MPKQPLVVCVTGAAGQIGYAITPMICNGDMFGPDQPVILHLLDLPFCMESLGGVVMEIEDGNYPLVYGVVATSDVGKAFSGADCAVLLGAFPRKQGMERKELMEKNIGIFKTMGEAVEKNASPNIKVLVVGNPANTNALVMSHFAPKVPKTNFTAMTRLDHHRALGQLALKAGCSVRDVQNVIIWGNHSSTQYPDVNSATINGRPVRSVINDDKYLNGEFIELIQKRGAAIISARKASSALSAARAAVTHMRSWFCGTAQGEYVSMGVLSDGNEYGVKPGLMYSFPCTCKEGQWSIVGGLKADAFSKEKMKATEAELQEEKDLAMSLV